MRRLPFTRSLLLATFTLGIPLVGAPALAQTDSAGNPRPADVVNTQVTYSTQNSGDGLSVGVFKNTKTTTVTYGLQSYDVQVPYLAYRSETRTASYWRWDSVPYTAGEWQYNDHVSYKTIRLVNYGGWGPNGTWYWDRNDFVYGNTIFDYTEPADLSRISNISLYGPWGRAGVDRSSNDGYGFGSLTW